MKRTSTIRRVSTKRARQLRQYAKQRKDYLSRVPICELWTAFDDAADFESIRKIWGNYPSIPPATEIHHAAGRMGLALLDEENWKALSRPAHTWLHANPSFARKMGFLK